MSKIYDTIIVGAGPSGLYAAFCLLNKGLDVLVIESLDNVGGQLSSLYPEKNIYNLPGFIEIKASTFIDNLHKQVLNKNKDCIITNTIINDLSRLENNNFKVTCENNDFLSKTIIIASGNGNFKPKELGINNEEKYENILYSINDLNKLENKNVVIFGGGDSAVDWALHLENIASSTTIVHRRNEFRAHESNIDLLKECTVNIKTPFTYDSINASSNIINSIFIKDKEDNIEELKTDYIIVSYGFHTSFNHLEEWGLENINNKIIVNHKYETNITGVFAIGDCCYYPEKNKNIVSGISEALTATQYIIKELNLETTTKVY